MKQYVVIVHGDMDVFGPFPSFDAAYAYGDENYKHKGYSVRFIHFAK